MIDIARILKDDLATAVLDIAQLVRAAGGRAYLVGGAVRDYLLANTPCRVPAANGPASLAKDADVEVFGVTSETLERLLAPRYPFDPVGLAFGVLKLRHLDVDVALPRRESKAGLGHRGFLIASDPALSLREAAARRDFTINAIYLDPLAGTLEDPFGGVKDLQAGILRHVSEHFAEDPLRVLRGMQFVARFDLFVAPETIEICRRMKPEGLPPERLMGEWTKLLVKGRAIGRGLCFLRVTQWLRHYPELKVLVDCRQDPEWHPEGSVWNHTCLALDAFAAERPAGRDAENLIVGLAVLCHDFGKPATTHHTHGRLRSRGHDVAGVAPTLSFLRRLTNEERILKCVPPLVAEHMQPFAFWKGKAKDGAIRRLAIRTGGHLDWLLRVASADDHGRQGIKPGSPCPELEWLAAQAERLRVAAAIPKPILQGRHLIQAGFRPGPQFSKILKDCYEAQLDGAFSDLPGALAYFNTYQRTAQKR